MSVICFSIEWYIWHWFSSSELKISLWPWNSASNKNGPLKAHSRRLTRGKSTRWPRPRPERATLRPLDLSDVIVYRFSSCVHAPQFVHWGPITSASRLKKTRMLIKCKLLSPFNNVCLHHRACAPVRPRLISRTTGPVKPAINWSP